MNCRNCPDRTYCYAPTITWNVTSRKESSEILLRILRCRKTRFGM
ncbi:MAG: hypothetical protein WA705_16375 [Candidatus Ozemobacteraceae bacterium]